MKKALTISVIINILFILFGGYVIQKKGGIDYLKRKFGIQTEVVSATDYGVYYKTKKSIFEIMPNDTNEIIFLGNSITDYCEWHELFGKANIKNRGIGGDIINGVYDRLNEIVESNPKKIFLMIGINDLARKRTVEQILSDYERLIISIKEKSPRTRLYIQSILPTVNRDDIKSNDIITINKGLMNLTTKYNLTYVDLFDLLRTNENKLDTVYTFDGVHVNGQGYLLWKKAIVNYVNN